MQKSQWLIPDLLPAEGVTLLYGRGSTGKSYTVLDMARAVASGTPWRERPVKKEKATLVVTEGELSTKLRFAALHADHDADLGLISLGCRGGLRILEDFPSFVKAVEGSKLIVLDSLTTAFPFDYEDTEAVERAVSLLQRISRAVGCAVLVVEAKSTEGFPPGFATLFDSSVCAIECLRRKDERTLKIRKHPEDLGAEILPFRLTPYRPPAWPELDEDGDVSLPVCRVDQVAYK